MFTQQYNQKHARHCRKEIETIWSSAKDFQEMGKKTFQAVIHPLHHKKNNSKMHPSKKMKKKSCHLFRPRHLSHYFLIDSFSGEFQLQ